MTCLHSNTELVLVGGVHVAEVCRSCGAKTHTGWRTHDYARARGRSLQQMRRVERGVLREPGSVANTDPAGGVQLGLFDAGGGR